VLANCVPKQKMRRKTLILGCINAQGAKASIKKSKPLHQLRSPSPENAPF